MPLVVAVILVVAVCGSLVLILSKPLLPENVLYPMQLSEQQQEIVLAVFAHHAADFYHAGLLALEQMPERLAEYDEVRLVKFMLTKPAASPQALI